jgi:hypothetical protein
LDEKGNDERFAYSVLILAYFAEHSVFCEELRCRKGCTLSSIFNYLVRGQVLPTEVEYSFAGINNSKIFAKTLRGLVGNEVFPKIVVGSAGSMKDQVYRQVVKEIEGKHRGVFGRIKKAFCERHGVELL